MFENQFGLLVLKEACWQLPHKKVGRRDHVCTCWQLVDLANQKDGLESVVEWPIRWISWHHGDADGTLELGWPWRCRGKTGNVMASSVRVCFCDNGRFPWQRVLPALNSNWENKREGGVTGWTTALDWELAWSDSLAAGKELVTGSKVPSDLLQLKSGHSENLDLTRLFLVLRYSSSKYNSSMKRLDVNRSPPRCISAIPRDVKT